MSEDYMWKPSVICIDFETTGLLHYRKDFRIVSMAATWRSEEGVLVSEYIEGEAKCKAYLILKVGSTPLIVHNANFEMGCFIARMKTYRYNIQFDTMRLVQVLYGRGFNKETGLSLEKCARRVLPEEYHNHKQPYLDWIIENKQVSKKDAGQYLSELPPEMLKEYNILDTEITYRLYEECVEYAKELKYDFSLDHGLYLTNCLLWAKSKVRGTPVDREGLAKCVEKKEEQIFDKHHQFMTLYAKEIDEIEKDKRDAWVQGPKTARGREGRRVQLNDPEYVLKNGLNFSINSPKDKARLFTDKLKCDVKFFTPGGDPSFKGSHMKSYGEGGTLIAKTGGIKIVQNQTESMLEMTEYDGRYHPECNITGTQTGRQSGSRGE